MENMKLVLRIVKRLALFALRFFWDIVELVVTEPRKALGQAVCGWALIGGVLLVNGFLRSGKEAWNLMGLSILAFGVASIWAVVWAIWLDAQRDVLRRKHEMRGMAVGTYLGLCFGLKAARLMLEKEGRELSAEAVGRLDEIELLRKCAEPSVGAGRKILMEVTRNDEREGKPAWVLAVRDWFEKQDKGGEA